ncbi:MAG: hypothetical protein WAT29_14950 [Thiolinea sp.]
MKTLTINRKKYGVNIQESYFSSEQNSQLNYDLRVNFCVENQGKHTTKALTSVIDLTQDAEKIIYNFRLSHRRGIQDTLKSGDYIYKFTSEPCSEDIKSFCAAYDAFAFEKNLPLCNQGKLLFFAGQSALVLTNVHCAYTGELFCQHAFISNKERARLLYSVSNFRVDSYDSVKRRQVSKIHRSLHWFEMNQFKSLNYKIYDLGGLAQCDDPQLENINHFKRGFGGVDIQEYVNFTPKTLKGWVAMRYLMKKL